MASKPLPSSQSQRKPQNKSFRTLGSLLRYFIGCELGVELKTGRIYRGILDASDDSMSLTLSDAWLSVNPHQSSSVDDHEQHSTSQRHALLSIRGSQIRYIHFPDDANVTAIIKQGVERESAARKQYQRQIRSGSKK
jgi:small nuclear ribonucleoprotein (snRNP)-like protein